MLDLGLVGEVSDVNVELLTLLEADYVPVVASVGVGPDGESYNINADTVAGALAAALKAEKVIFLTDVGGLLRDVDDESSRCRSAPRRRSMELMESGKVSEGMIPKLEAVLTSLEGGARAPTSSTGASRTRCCWRS